MNSEDFEGIFKFKFFIPFFYIASWTCMIFGPLFFKEVYQVICMVIVSYSMLKTIGLISGSIYAICKLNSIISSFEEEKERKNIETNEVIQNSKIVHAIVIPNYK